jgi:hypothetical protein
MIAFGFLLTISAFIVGVVEAFADKPMSMAFQRFWQGVFVSGLSLLAFGLFIWLWRMFP